MRKEILSLKEEIKKEDKEIKKLTKKSSLLVSYFNAAMLQTGTTRENYFSCNLNGNNVSKYLKNFNSIFAIFFEKIASNYPNFALTSRCNDYRELFKRFKEVYDNVNHSKKVSDLDCDRAQASIDNYMDWVHSTMKWKTCTNKVIF